MPHAIPFVCLIIIAVVTAETSRDPLVIRHADGFEYLNRGGERVEKLTGRVRIEYRTTTITADTAVHFSSLDRIEFFNNVRLSAGSQTLCSDRLVYYKRDSTATAKGRVVMTDSTGRVRLSGGEGRYRRDTETARLWDNPVLLQFDSARNETLRIVSREIEHRGRDKITAASGSVVITQGKMRVTCGRAEYFKTQEMLVFMDAPVMVQDSDRLSGDSMRLHFRGDTLDRMVVLGGARGDFLDPHKLFPDSSQVTVLRGDTLTAWFVNREMRRMEVCGRAGASHFFRGDSAVVNRLSGRVLRCFFSTAALDSVHVFDNASSVYNYTEAGGGGGVNETTGDTVAVYFNDKRVSRLWARGGIRGVYSGR